MTSHSHDSKQPHPELTGDSLPQSLSPDCYHSESTLEAEHQHLFGQHWLGLGRTDRLAQNGDFETLEIGRISIILVRDQAGELRALSNTCRHRGTRLLEGKDRCRTIRCPFHGWTYGLDGRLVVAPQFDDLPGFNRETHGLRSYPLRSEGGFLFICLAEDPPDWEEAIGNFSALHADWPLDELVTARRIQFDVDCNWKLFLEVFNEYYHLDCVHPGSISSLYKTPEPANATVGNYVTQFGFTKGRGGLMENQQDDAFPDMPDLKGDAALGTRYTWLYPNMTFAASSEALWMYEALPLTPGRCRVFQTICFHRDTFARTDFETRAASYYQRFDTAIEEDIVVLEQQQLGMSDLKARSGPIHPLVEGGVAGFAGWYRAEIADSAAN